MKQEPKIFDLQHSLQELKHYLPSQAPLKDFIHHNTLHAFQHLNFHEALGKASKIFGYKTYLGIQEYRNLYQKGEISSAILERSIQEKKGFHAIESWKEMLLDDPISEEIDQRVGKLRAIWKKEAKINLDKGVHSLLFRVVCAYLDQGISIWNFPLAERGFLEAIKDMERNSFSSLFNTKYAKNLLLQSECKIEDLLKIVVGNESLYEQYLFDQQFCHPGWSGMVAVLEANDKALIDRRKISLEDFIRFELLLEIDILYKKFNTKIEPLATFIKEKPLDNFAPIEKTLLNDWQEIWQDAYEWSFYDQVLGGIAQASNIPTIHHGTTFQALLCIDDREAAFQTHIEKVAPDCKVFCTPGFFGIDCYFKPANSNFHTKSCPAPLSPKYLIKELDSNKTIRKDHHFTKNSHTLLGGFLVSMTFGFWSAIQLMINMFKPGHSAVVVSSFRHMDKHATLTVENKDLNDTEDGLQVGFTVLEMANRVEGLLKSIGLVENFANIIYVLGHGASSVNNTHYAGYDCGACSGRPGSVNARAFAFMANHPKVRIILEERGILIPETTQFLGGLHETTRDEIVYYDIDSLSEANQVKHREYANQLNKALDYNAKERSRRFILMNNKNTPQKVHEQVKLRAVSLFEPRPELNHATNALCIVGRREMTDHLFLDRRAFMNSFDYRIDPEGKYLLNILNAAAPVCGGINLEYYFSRVDNYRLGAGTKLPHNVMGLFGVANGMDGDLRTGLPSQMIEVHDPVRLLIIVEHKPEVVLKTIQTNPATYEWFIHAWVKLVVVDPETKYFYHFQDGQFVDYHCIAQNLEAQDDVLHFVEKSENNLPVCILND